MKKILVVTLALLLFPILGLAARGGPDSMPAEASSTPTGAPPAAELLEINSEPVSPLSGDSPHQRQIASQPTPVLAPVLSGDPRAGERLFAVACGKCHGRKRDGNLDLRSGASKEDFTAESANLELFAIIKTGRAADGTRFMQPKGGNPALTDENLYDIVAFIRSLDQ